MTVWMTIRQDGVDRRIEVEKNPISIGGEGSTLPIRPPGSPASSNPVALIGVLGGRPFIQRAERKASDQGEDTPVFLDEQPVEASRWLEGRGQIRVGPLRIGYEPRGREWLLRVESLDGSPDPVGRRIVEPIPYRFEEPDIPVPPVEVGRSWRTLVLVTIGILFAALVIGSFTALRSVGIDLRPEPEWIEIQGGMSVRVGGRWWLRPGSYVVTAEKTGYEPLTRTIEVENSQNFSFAFTPLPGLLSIATDPVEEASVSIDGESIGKTPIEDWSLQKGIYQLRVTAPLHRDLEQSLEIEGLGNEQRISLTLEPAWAELSVTSRPEGAELLVDGRSAGKTPVALQAGEGKRRISLRLEGFEEWRESVQIVAQQNLALGPVELTPSKPKPKKQPRATPIAEPKPKTDSVPAVHAPRIEAKDGSELLLIRGGPLLMGTPRGQQGRRTNERERQVLLERPFYLATRETTNAQFLKFRKSHDSGYLRSISLGDDDQPVVQVSWQQAAAYCNWLSKQEGLPAAYQKKRGELRAVLPMNTGYRLPTEAEWSYAARAESTDRYPWGSGFPPPPDAGNFGDISARAFLSVYLSKVDDGHAITAPVASFEPNRLGFFDLGGNVSEWNHDYYSADGGAGTDPAGPPSGTRHVIRGSSFRKASITQLRTAYRDSAVEGRDDLGFRIARYAE